MLITSANCDILEQRRIPSSGMSNEGVLCGTKNVAIYYWHLITWNVIFKIQGVIYALTSYNKKPKNTRLTLFSITECYHSHAKCSSAKTLTSIFKCFTLNSLILGITSCQQLYQGNDRAIYGYL